MAVVTYSWGFDVLIIVLSASAAFYWFMTRHFKYWEKRNVFEFVPTPIFGNFADCILQRKSAGHFMRDMYSKAKGHKLLGFYVFHKPFLMVRDPEIIKHILIKDFDYFQNHHAKASKNDTLGGANLFIVRNPAWKYCRTKLTPIYTSGKLKKMFELMLDVAADLDNYMELLKLGGKGKEMGVKELCAKFTTDLIGTTAYGLKVNSLNNPDAEFRQAGKRIFTFNTWRSLEIVSLFFLPEIGNFMGFEFFTRESAKFLRDAFWGTINERIKSGIKRNDLLDLLIELRKKQQESGDYGEFKFDGDNLVAQASIFFTGGFETSSTVMAFSMYELAIQLEIQTKLRMEIKQTLEKCNNQLTVDAITAMPYMEMVTAEALRKYPPLPFLDREASADYQVPNSDLVIKKGTPVVIPMLGLHFDPEYFPEPDKFIPDRFADNKSQVKSCTYLPFGDGPHSCIGLRLGLIQAKLGLIHILKNYEVTPCSKTPIPMKISPKALITAPDGGEFYLNFRKINH